MDFSKVPREYWYAFGDLGEAIATPHFIRHMESVLGWPPEVVAAHAPLYTKFFPIDNFDEEACHLDLVAVTMRANLKYWVHAIAEVKSTFSYRKKEFTLNGMSPRYVHMAMNAKIPVFLYVVRLPEAPPENIITEDGMMDAYMKFKSCRVDEYPSDKFKLVDDKIIID